MEGVSSAAIEVLVQNLVNLFKDEYSLLRDLDKDAQQLQRTLETIQAYLKDAEKKSITQDSAKIWLRDLEAVAFDANNVLDELSYHLLHKKVKKMKSSKDKVLSCFSSFNGILRRRDMALTIKQLNATFECMNKRATPTPNTHTSIETDSFSLDPIFIGREEEMMMCLN